MKTVIYTIILFILPFSVFPQGEANIWYFGDNAGLDFNNGSPVVLLDGALDTNEGCASISDSNGNLIFYTDGNHVYNASHQEVPNSGLAGSSSSTHSAVIVPKPNFPNIYYVFTVGDGGAGSTLSYSEFDLTLDGGLGNINQNKNIILDYDMNEKITAIQNADSSGYWVVSHRYDSDEFVVFEISSAGLNTTPNLISVGSNTGVFNVTGQIKISPDNSKLAVARGGEVQLFDFDNSNGTISNPQTINSGSYLSYGIEFSADGNLLYLAYFGGVSQYNLQAGSTNDIISSEVVLINIPNQGFASMQIAPDGKIYIARQDLPYVDYINSPSTIGLGCGLTSPGINLQGAISRLGLPTFIQSFFSITIDLQNNCFGDSTLFSFNTSDNIDSILWDFGDNTTSTLETPSHVYNAPGDYQVSVTVTSNGETYTEQEIISIFQTPIANSIEDQIRCVETPFFTYTYDLTVHDNNILDGQNPDQFILEYYASIESYNSNDPLDNPQMIELMVGGNADFVVSIHNINNPECEDFTTVRVDVYQTPGINQNLPELSFCYNDSVGDDTDGLIEIDLTQIEFDLLSDGPSSDVTVNYYTDDLFSNQISSPENYQNSNATEVIYVEAFFNSTPECKSTTSFVISVEGKPNIDSLVSLTQCDVDLDGFSLFNLTEINAELSANFQNETFTYYETQTDAENDTNPITEINNYLNETPSTDTIWVRVENDNNCYDVAEVSLNVATTQIPESFQNELYACDDGADTTDGIATFNLTSYTTAVEALFPTNQNLDINYFRNQEDALSENNPIIDLANYQNIGYPNTQDVFIRVEDENNNCIGLGHHITLNVLSVPTANPVNIDEQCDDDGDGVFAFNTTGIQDTVLNNQTDVIVEYYDEAGNPLPSPLPNPFTTSSQDITARVINQSAQTLGESCFDETIISFSVQEAVTAHPILDYTACDDDNDGIATFDISALETQLLNGQTQVEVFYTDAQGNALPNPLPDTFETESTTITAQVESTLSEACFDETIVNFLVFTQPVANPVEAIFICDELNDTQENLLLSSLNPQVLASQSSDDFEVLFYDDPDDADLNTNPLPDDIQVNSSNQTYFARIQNIDNPDCYDVTAFEVSLSYQPTAFTPQNLWLCNDGTNDQVEPFDLSQQDQSILNDQLIDQNTVTYHLSLEDAENNTNPILETFENSSNPQMIYARVENNLNPSCFSTTSFEIEVLESPNYDIEEFYTLCEDASITIGVDDIFDEYLWSTGEITSTIQVNEPGSYGLIIAYNYAETNCEQVMDFNVINSNPATIVEVNTKDWARGNNSIEVLVMGQGDYEYSLDGVNYQISNIFNSLTEYEYLVHVRDKNGCGISLKRVYLLDYPDFFTPNGDGFNDYWQIINAKQEIFTKTLIFDRYGKLVADIHPGSPGWDGTMNGRPMPSNDYWFKVTREDGRVFTGHFTLKR